MTQKLLINAILKYAGSRYHWVTGYKTRSFNFLCIFLLVRACRSTFHSWNGLGPALYVCWLFWDKPGVILGFIFRFRVSINYFGSFTVFNDIKMKQLEESVFFQLISIYYQICGHVHTHFHLNNSVSNILKGLFAIFLIYFGTNENICTINESLNYCMFVTQKSWYVVNTYIITLNYKEFLTVPTQLHNFMGMFNCLALK